MKFILDANSRRRVYVNKDISVRSGSCLLAGPSTIATKGPLEQNSCSDATAVSIRMPEGPTEKETAPHEASACDADPRSRTSQTPTPFSLACEV